MKSVFKPTRESLIGGAFESGVIAENARIIKLLETEASEWLSHDSAECDCRVKGLEVHRLIEVIKGKAE